MNRVILFGLIFVCLFGCVEKENEKKLVADIWKVNIHKNNNPAEGFLCSVKFILKADTLKYLMYKFYEKSDSIKLANQRNKEVIISSTPPLMYDKYTQKYCIINYTNSNTCFTVIDRKERNICQPLNKIFDDVLSKNDTLDFTSIINKISNSIYSPTSEN